MITPSIINEFFGIREPKNAEKFDSKALEITLPAINFLKSRKYINPYTAPTHVSYNELDSDPAFMLSWARFSLLPVSSASSISADEVRFLLCLLKG